MGHVACWTCARCGAANNAGADKHLSIPSSNLGSVTGGMWGHVAHVTRVRQQVTQRCKTPVQKQPTGPSMGHVIYGACGV